MIQNSSHSKKGKERDRSVAVVLSILVIGVAGYSYISLSQSKFGQNASSMLVAGVQHAISAAKQMKHGKGDKNINQVVVASASTSATTSVPVSQSPIVATSTVASTIPATTSASSTPTKAIATSTVIETQNVGYGFSIGDTFLNLNNTQLNAELADMASIGVGRIRIDFDWGVIQPSNSTTYNWSQYDAFVAAANAHHIQILGVIGYTPAWARSSGCNSEECPPANDTQFATYAAAVAARYAPQGVHDWEIWNEPNNAGFWVPVANAQDYTALLVDTYPAIKKVDPSSVVVTGGLAAELTDGLNIAPIDFLTTMYVDGAGPYFDAVGSHPYAFPALPSGTQSWNAWYQMFGTSPSLRSIMIANGDSNKQIWVTEFGAPTGGPSSNGPVSEAAQSQIISQAVTLKQSYSWAGPIFFYSYKDLGTSTNTIENFFGIIRFDGSLKPAYTALKQALSS